MWSMTHGAALASLRPMDAAHTENSDREQSAPPMNGGQSQRPRSRLHTPCFSHPGAQALPSARGSGGGGEGKGEGGGTAATRVSAL